MNPPKCVWKDNQKFHRFSQKKPNKNPYSKFNRQICPANITFIIIVLSTWIISSYNFSFSNKGGVNQAATAPYRYNTSKTYQMGHQALAEEKRNFRVVELQRSPVPSVYKMKLQQHHTQSRKRPQARLVTPHWNAEQDLDGYCIIQEAFRLEL